MNRDWDKPKSCSRCKLLKPVLEFQTKGRWLHSWCKQCQREYRASYRKSHPSESQLKAEIAKSQIPTCEKHGNHPNFTWSKSRFWCGICRKEKERASDRRKSARRTRIGLLSKYGQDFASLYDTFPRTQGERPGSRLFKIKKHIISASFGLTPTDGVIYRVEQLNRLSKRPLMSTDPWACTCCGMVHKMPTFFDVDHINPKARGGHNKHSNLQILCPNCHRRKTCKLDGFSESQCFIGRVEVNEISSVDHHRTQTDSLIKQSESEHSPAADIMCVTAASTQADIPASALLKASSGLFVGVPTETMS